MLSKAAFWDMVCHGVWHKRVASMASATVVSLTHGLTTRTSCKAGLVSPLTCNTQGIADHAWRRGGFCDLAKERAF